MPKYQVDLAVTIRLTVEVEAPDIDACWKGGDKIAHGALHVYNEPVVANFEHQSAGLASSSVLFVDSAAGLLDYYLDEVEMVRALPEGAA